MRKLLICCVLLALAAVPSFAGTINVLYWTDYNVGTSVIPGAIALVPGAVGTAASDQSDFNTKLAAGGWDVVIFGEQNTSVWGGSSADITSYVSGGGKVIGATWLTGSGMASFFDATLYASTNSNYITTDSNPIFAGLGPTVGLYNPGWGVFSLGFGTGATCAGTLEYGGCGAIIGNGGQTILNAALFDSYSPQAGGEQLVANEIMVLAGATATPEPASLLLLGAGFSLLAIRRKR
jgi:hypothetical protein